MNDNNSQQDAEIAENQERDETPLERLDRNWTDLLQELRVSQTGVQLLAGFLLTLPFQTEFTKLSDYQRYVYLVTVGSAIAATGFLIGPVSLHRVLFRQHLRHQMVTAGHYLAIFGLFLLGCAVIGVVLLTFSVVIGDRAGVLAAVVTLLLLGGLWAAIPLSLRGESGRRDR
jgi:hypothetical protein